ncbi:glycosyltransferase family 2 protein [Mucilaginibacter sp.]|uniref:glycosyltransferase family 2 protein n=1 Tax=Mucilaginibacter sp. TaxID=1882438 RepID=UPI002630B858|nr:glycosyltransferase family 2 protein [Mucilaginibacter sp.]MDB5031057.1 wbbL 4 [Mucilaginibacter sp.]
MDKKSISIVIPNYNGRQLLAEYLPYTFAAIENANVAYEVIVVDDASTDTSVEFIKQVYPQLTLLINEQNSGFSFTCNQGIAAAQYELILLLNSDVKLAPDYFEQQFKYFEADDTFGVMGRIIDMDGDGIQDAARLPKFNGLKLKTEYFYYTEDTCDRLYTLYLSGANALIDAAKLKEIGGFYELFSPFYCEDMELSIRAWKLGWKCYYEHQSVCRHQVSASTKNYQKPKWIKSTYYRNRFYLHALHLNGLALFCWYVQITLIDLLPKLLTGQTWIWKSYKELFKNSHLIDQYKERLTALLNKHGSNRTIFNVVNTIRLSVKNKKIIKVKLS